MGRETLFVGLIPPTRKPRHAAGDSLVRRAHPTKGDPMSSVNKAKNKAQEAKGHLKDAAGKATNDRTLQAKGKGDKAAGNLKQAGEKVKDAFRK
jgi:uncharacterized protein YjbJ (UPF0337 family)